MNLDISHINVVQAVSMNVITFRALKASLGLCQEIGYQQYITLMVPITQTFETSRPKYFQPQTLLHITLREEIKFFQHNWAKGLSISLTSGASQAIHFSIPLLWIGDIRESCFCAQKALLHHYDFDQIFKIISYIEFCIMMILWSRHMWPLINMA